MHDAARMCGAERIGDLNGEPQRFVERKCAPRQTIGQRLALQVLHDEIRSPLVLPYVVQRADVRVCKLRDGARFAIEALTEVGVGVQMRREGL